MSLRTEFELPGLSATVTGYAAATVQDPHRHSSSSIALVLEGGLLETANGRGRILGPGCVLVKPRDVVHADLYGGVATRLLALSEVSGSRGRRLASLLRTISGRQRYSVLRDPAITAAFLALHRELISSARRERVAAAMELLARTLEVRAPRGSAWCDSVAAAIERDPSRTTHELAADLRVHPVSLARAFRRRHGRSPSSYARRVRAERAASSIARGASIITAAHESAFCDQAHFTRVFRGEFGVSPSVFRDLVSARGS